MITISAQDERDEICEFGIAIACEYTKHMYVYITGQYLRCMERKDFCNNVNNQTKIFEYECPSHDNPLVEVFDMPFSKLKHVPRNLEKYFPNLLILKLNFNRINLISNSDFKSYKNLRVIDFSENEISRLDTDIFDGLPNLEKVLLNDNRIKNIGHDVKFPPYTLLDGNICYDSAMRRKLDLDLLLLQYCPPLISQISQALQIRENSKKEMEEPLINDDDSNENFDFCEKHRLQYDK